MLIGSLRVWMRVEWANSLKDKRMVVQSVCAKLRARFGVAVAEVEEMDNHRTIVLGIAYVSNAAAHLDSVMDNILAWLDGNPDAQVTGVERDIL